MRADGSQAVAVGLLFSFAHPAHEAAVAARRAEAEAETDAPDTQDPTDAEPG